MKGLLAGAGRRFIHAAAAAFIVLAIAVSNATDVDSTYSYGVVFLLALGAAGLKFIAEVLPFLSWHRYVKNKIVAAYMDAFTQAFGGALIITLPDVLDSPDLSTARILALAALQGAFTAGFRGVEGVLTRGESPLPGVGVPPAEPPAPPPP